MKLLKAGILIAAAALPTAAAGVSWQDILSEAALKNPVLKQAGYAVSQAEFYRKRNVSAFLPSLSASASTGLSAAGSADARSDSSAGVSGSLSLFSGFADTANLKISETDLSTARFQRERDVSDTVYRLKRDYLETLWAQEMVTLSEQILKRREENLELIRLKYEAGREDKGSLLRVEADRFRAGNDLEKARRYRKTAVAQLQRSIGRDTLSPLSVEGELTVPEPPESASPEELALRTPEYRIAENAVRRAGLSVTAARSAFYPDVSLRAGVARAGTGGRLDESRWSAGIDIAFPFFNGMKNTYDTRIATIGRDAAAEAFREARLNLASSIAAAHNGLLDALDDVEVAARYLEAARRQSEITTQKYMNGLVSYQDWHVIENDYIDARKSILNARKAALLAHARWVNLCGNGEYR